MPSPPSDISSPPDSPYRRGFRRALPLMVGAVMFGLATGAATASAGMSELVMFSLPAVFYAGVAQLAYAQLFALGAPFVSILATLVLINLRYLIYATIASTWEPPRSRFLRAVLPYFVTESAFAMALQEQPRERSRFLLGAGCTLWATWVVSCIAGSLLAGQLPPLKHAYAVPAIVLAPILMALIRGRQRIAVAAVAFAVGLALVAMPYRLGPLLAGVGAVVAVMLAGAAWSRRA